MTQATIQELKKCPFCAELIKSEAIVCPHCQRSLAKPKSLLTAAFPLAFGAMVIWTAINMLTIPPYWTLQGTAGILSYLLVSVMMNLVVCYIVSIIIFAIARSIKGK